MTNSLGAPGRILVLGGGSDIGQAIAARFVEDGGVQQVVLAGRRPGDMAERFDARRPQDDAAGTAQVATVDYDATQPGAAAKAIAAASADGDVDLIVVAAGVLGTDEHNRLAHRATELLGINLVAAVEAVMEAIDRFEAQGHGRLVVLSSVAGLRVRGGLATYGASKAGLDAFCRAMQQRLAGAGVDLLIVRPGFVHSAMTDGLPPAPFATDPASVAADVAAAVAAGRAVVWSPPVLRWVFAILRNLPEPIWRRVSGR